MYTLRLLLALLLAGVRAEDEEASGEDDSSLEPIPDPLTMANFDNTLDKGFHIVEFFSPYCPHCMHFKPDWEAYWRTNHAHLLEKSDLQLHQVDCVASGELCDKEGILYYPNIRLYAASGKLLGTMGNNYKRDKVGLTAFIEDQLSVWVGEDTKTAAESGVELETHLIDSKKMVSLIANDESIVAPLLVSFWPSTDDALSEDLFQGDHKSVPFFKQYTEAYAFRNLWNGLARSLTKQVQDGDLELGYFNCGSHAAVCKKLQIKSGLHLRHGDETLPTVMMFLPSTAAGNQRIVYNEEDPFAAHDLAAWTKRLLDIYRFKDVRRLEIEEQMGIVTSVPNGAHDIPDYSQVSFVLLEDPETHVAEDDEVLSQILQPVMDLKENVYLYRSTDKAGFTDVIRKQAENLENKYVNGRLPEDSPDRVEFDEAMYLTRTLSTYPMLLCIKSNSLISPVMKSFRPKDIRDPEKVVQFVRENSAPLARPMTPRTVAQTFPKFDRTINDASEKVLVALMELKPREIPKVGHAISYVWHKYSLLRQKQQFAQLEESRGEKREEVLRLKENDAKFHDIVKEMSKKVASVYDKHENELQVTYVDIDKLESFADKLGWKNIDPAQYKAGNMLVFSRFGNSFWDRDAKGSLLDVDHLDDTVSTILEASYHGLKGRYIATPYMKILGGIALALVGAVFALRVIRRVLRRRRLRANRIKGLGILGVDPDLQSTELSKFE